MIKMYGRTLQPPEKQSFFLFGARGVGKSTLLKHHYSHSNAYFIDLLNLTTEEKYLRNPQQLEHEILALPATIKIIIIDEIQKLPKLLDIVHSLIEKTSLQFILTGSSARKLKRGHANMLAGRAIVKNLFPLSFLELDSSFNLEQALQFGTLPQLFSLDTTEERQAYLRTYCHVYLKEEVWAEHLIRKLEPFQYFLEVAAQSNGKIINHSKIAKTVGVDHKSIEQYYSILEDTLIGFSLTSYQKSFRKRLLKKPKFYFIDTGIVRALSNLLTIPVTPRTYDYGDAFEHLVITECYKQINYSLPDYRLSYLKTTTDQEIDLIVERPGKKLLLIEIKSANEIIEEKLVTLNKLQQEFSEPSEAVCFANVEKKLQIGEITIYPWQEGIQTYFLST